MTAPDALAAMDARLFLFFGGDGAEGTESDQQIRVLSIEAVRAGVENTWRYLPERRLVTHPVLPASGVIDRAWAMDGSIFARVTRPDGTAATFTLTDEAWAESDAAPPERMSSPVRMTRDGSGLDVAMRLADAPALPLAGFEIAEDAAIAAVVLPAPKRSLVMLWIERDTQRPRGGPTTLPLRSGPRKRVRIAELSLETGRVLYQGPVRSGVPLAVGDLRLIAAGLVLLMAAALVVVMRPAADPGVAPLPTGVALLSGGRRTLASFIDVTLVAGLVSAGLGIPLSALLGPELFLQSTRGWTLIPAIMLAGTLYGTVCEAAFGSTLGKALIGGRVVHIPPERATDGEAALARPPFSSAMIRNAIKWVLSPVALLGLLDGSLRHRGDLFAKTAVVEEESPAEEDERS